jgi:hypothetical protein
MYLFVQRVYNGDRLSEAPVIMAAGDLGTTLDEDPSMMLSMMLSLALLAVAACSAARTTTCFAVSAVTDRRCDAAIPPIVDRRRVTT